MLDTSKLESDMKLPDGKVCSDCVHCYRCTLIFGAKRTNTECDFYPIRFKEKHSDCDAEHVPEYTDLIQERIEEDACDIITEMKAKDHD